MVGNYDTIKQPKVIAEGFDYVMYSNDIPEQQLGVWRVRHIPFDIAIDNTRLTRWVKTHPHILFPDYEYSLYMDANVVVDDIRYYERINDLISQGHKLSVMDHNLRWCIYEEALFLMYVDFDSVKNICREMLYIKHQGYPQNNGLNENNCILRKHNDPSIVDVNEEWWSMICRFSKRDQLSFRYSAWKYDVHIEKILPTKQNSRNHPYLHCEKHITTPTKKDIVWFDIREQYIRKVRKVYFKMIDKQSDFLTERISFIALRVLRLYYDMVIFKYIMSSNIQDIIGKRTSK